MYLRLRELATLSNLPIYPLIDINDDVRFSLAILNLCLPRLIPLNAILITVMHMYVKLNLDLYFSHVLF